MEAYQIVILIFLIFASLILLAAYFSCRIAFKREKTAPDPFLGLDKEKAAFYRDRCIALIESLAARPYEAVSVKAHDGLKLCGKFYKGDEGKPIHIMFHGYRSVAGRDFAGGAEECIALSHSVLLVDQRAHGDSEGKNITFGVKERRDVHTWIEFVNNNLKGDIFLWGISMGAATVLMSLEFPMQKNVIGVIADCPYSSPKEIIKLVGRRGHLPVGILFPVLRLGAMIFSGFRMGNCSAVSTVKNAKIPVILIHGEEDNFVPLSMSRAIYESGKKSGADIRLFTFKDAHHGTSYLMDSERYLKIVTEFMNECKEKAISNG